MIDIINGYGFKRNFNNSIYSSINAISSIIGLQPYQIKEHFYFCVASDCHARGDFQIESIEDGELNIYLDCASTEYLIESLKREGFEVDLISSERFMSRMLETQSLVSEFFDKDDYYSDPIRKINKNVPELSESISKLPTEEFDFSEIDKLSST